jgi:hypothetical protein
MRQVLATLAVVAVLGAWAGSAQAQCTFNAEKGDVFINEIFAQPKSAGDHKEWFEVTNLADGSKCLRGMKIKFIDGRGDTRTVTMATDVTVNGRGGVVWFGEYPNKTSQDALRDGEKLFSLKDGLGSIKLYKPDGTTLLHEVSYKNAPAGESLNFFLAYTCKPPDCTTLGSDDKGTPGASNANQFTQ